MKTELSLVQSYKPQHTTEADDPVQSLANFVSATARKLAGKDVEHRTLPSPQEEKITQLFVEK